LPAAGYIAGGGLYCRRRAIFPAVSYITGGELNNRRRGILPAVGKRPVIPAAAFTPSGYK